MSAIVEDTMVEVGDTVGFKSDVEQSGEIIKIKRSPYGGKLLVLKSHDDSGFDGYYIAGETETEQFAMNCWID